MRIIQFCRKWVAASVLVFVLACSTFAGEMQFPGVTAPPPPPSATGDMPLPGATSPTETVSGDMQYPGATESSLTETMFDLLQGVLSLF
jgi:hypothetical protein